MTIFVPLIPANAGTQFFRGAVCVGSPLYVLGSTDRPNHWVPAFAGMSGNL